MGGTIPIEELIYSMNGHYKVMCRTCGVVVAQCRCMDPAKHVTFVTCDACLKKATTGEVTGTPC